MKIEIDGWNLEIMETNACGLRINGISPKGRRFFVILFDWGQRLEKYGVDANIEFGSDSLRFSAAQAERLLAAARRYNAAQVAAEPDYRGSSVV